MGKVIFDMTASLDGFVAGSNASPELPMGEGGLRLFDWYFADDETSRSPEQIEPEIRDQAVQTTGALISGRRTYDNAHGWNGQHPIGVPVFVVTHHPPEGEEAEKFNGTFVTDGVESALRQAQAAAGDKVVAVASADIARQLLKAGLLDELSLHFVPVLLGGGVRLFDLQGSGPYELECTSVSNTSKVIHTTFRVIPS